MTAARKRKIAVVSVTDPAELAEQLANALRGRAHALHLLEQAIVHLRGEHG